MLNSARLAIWCLEKTQLELFPHTGHDCEKELETLYPNHAQANDGERWTCTCGKEWIHLCDEAEGCVWIEISES